MKSFLCTFTGVIGAAIGFLFGGWSNSILILLIFMIIDYITGLIVAGVFHKSQKTETGSLESNACLKGLVRKGMILVIVIIANLLDMQIGTTYIRDGVCIAFMVNELLSIIENAGLMGVPVPETITNSINVLKKKSDET